MRPRTLIALSGAAAWLLALVPAVTAHADDEERRLLVPTAIEGEAAPRILRGSAIAPAAPAVEAPAARPVRMAGGERLWLVDSGEGAVLACRLARTTQIGRRAIACTTGRLPPAWR